MTSFSDPHSQNKPCTSHQWIRRKNENHWSKRSIVSSVFPFVYSFFFFLHCVFCFSPRFSNQKKWRSWIERLFFFCLSSSHFHKCIVDTLKFDVYVRNRRTQKMTSVETIKRKFLIFLLQFIFNVIWHRKIWIGLQIHSFKNKTIKNYKTWNSIVPMKIVN